MRYPVAPRARARLVKNTQLGETFQLPVDNDFNRFFGFNIPPISGADSVDCERWEEFFYAGFPECNTAQLYRLARVPSESTAYSLYRPVSSEN